MLWVGVVGAAQAADAPFSETPWSEARTQDGVVVFEITSKRSTCEVDPWTTGETGAWLTSHDATAVLLDRARHAGPIRKLVAGGREVVPMRIAYRDGKEADRACGCMDADALVSWMDGVSQGKTLADAARESIGDRDEGELDVLGELDVVRLNYCADRLGAALDGLLYLWQQIPERAPDYEDARRTRVAHDMAVLARASDDVTKRLEAHRDSLGEAKDTDFDRLDDWVALNRVLLQDDKTLAWYDANVSDPWFEKFFRHESLSLFVLFLEAGRWSDAGVIIDDPQSWLLRWKSEQGGLDEAAKGYAALMAAGRTREGGQFAREMLRVAPDGTECKMLAHAVEAGGVDKSQKKWVKACADEELGAKWTAALP